MVAELRYEGNYKSRKQGNPAVVLLDIRKPRMNGIEALQAVRNDSVLKIPPVVLLTSSREELDLKKSFKLGANAHVVKPVDFSDFIETEKQLSVFWAILNERPPERI
jgi:CheY-like chemotaxis protein